MKTHTQTVADFELAPSPTERVIRSRSRRPEPRFKGDISGQLDPFYGCPETIVPAKHLARTVWEQVQQIDTSTLEKKYSSLGRHGYHPRNKLAVWAYASLTGVHHASKVAELMKTDAAYRLLSGGHVYSAALLKQFRQDHRDFFTKAIDQTVCLAVEHGLIDPTQLAVDSARIEADASSKSTRRVARSRKRLEELEQVETAKLDEQGREKHEAKVEKHKTAVERCEREGRTSHSVTDPHAALMKFPDGAARLGHRVTLTSCGADVRFVIAVLAHASPNDYGQLEAAVRAAREALIAAGLKVGEGGRRIQVAADPGYLSEADLRFAEANRDWVDVLIHVPPASRRGRYATPGGFFSRDEFVIHADGSATCPAGQKMRGPRKNGERGRTWKGVGCCACPLRNKCTKGEERTLTQDPEVDRLHDAMKARMAQDGAKKRYAKRMATVEPVFSYIEDAMGYRRASSRKTETVKAEILLNVLAYNLIRLATKRPVAAIFFCAFGLGPREIRSMSAWMPIWPHLAEETPPSPDALPEAVVVDSWASEVHS